MHWRAAMQPLVSVIIPVYNGEKYLKDALMSVQNQDYQNIEIIVVNDGSTDHTQNVIDQFKDQVTCIKQRNRGLGFSLNRAIKLAKGQYLTFLDADDLWDRKKISSQMIVLNKKEDPLIFSHIQQFISSDLNDDQKSKVKVPSKAIPGYSSGTLLVSKKRFLEIGFFFEEKKLGEFIDWYLRAVDLGIPTHMMSDVFLYRRVHLNNMGRQKECYHQTDYLKILKASLDRRRALSIK